MNSKGADGMANSVDPDQTVSEICTVCLGLSVPILRIIKVVKKKFFALWIIRIHRYSWAIEDLINLCIN